MKRMHVHVAVADLAQSVDFYSALFATAPAVVRSDYAKWMLDDPSGIAWETFHTTGESTNYGDGTGERAARVAHEKPSANAASCCAPQPEPLPAKASACCGGKPV